MPKKITSIRGMHDLLPAHTPAWHHLEQTIQRLMAAYGYDEIRTPIVESTELFHRSIGAVTDIVEKEMYTFADRNGDRLSLRPENTASCVRAGIEHGLLHNNTQRLWYLGPMFRHERPQQGRYRQFHQLGAEAFGIAGPCIEVELILMSARLWKLLAIDGEVTLELNSLGDAADRQRYRATLIDYLEQHRQQLDEESARRLRKNPLRILDSKNPALQAMIAAAPRLTEMLSDTSLQHLDTLTSLLDANQLPYQINHRLVRGLDYYSHTVFEWTTDSLGAQGTICAGGRYDGLVEQLGGKPTPGVGWAVGIERLLALLEAKHGTLVAPQLHAYMVLIGDRARQHGLQLAEYLRDQIASLRMQIDCSGGSLKGQFKRADKSGASCALILGEEEIDTQTITVKLLRDAGGRQSRLHRAALCEYLATLQAGRQPGTSGEQHNEPD